MSFRNILIILTVVSISLATYFFNEWFKQKQENTRINNNFSALAAEIKLENFKHIQLLDMKVSELKKSFPDLVDEIKKEFDIKLRNIKSISNTVTTVNHTFKTTVKDSIILDTIPVQNIYYKDKWTDFEAQKVDTSFFVNKNLITVPLLQIVHRDKFRLKYIFKSRDLFQDITSDNPYANIIYSRVIQINK